MNTAHIYIHRKPQDSQLFKMIEKKVVATSTVQFIVLGGTVHSSTKPDLRSYEHASWKNANDKAKYTYQLHLS